MRQAAAQALAAAVGERRFARRCSPGSATTEGPCAQAVARALAGAVGEPEVRAALLARLGDDDGVVRVAAAQALAAAVGEREVRDALLARLEDRRLASAAAKVLGADILAEKFGLPAGEIDVVYP